MKELKFKIHKLVDGINEVDKLMEIKEFIDSYFLNNKSNLSKSQLKYFEESEKQFKNSLLLKQGEVAKDPDNNNI